MNKSNRLLAKALCTIFLGLLFTSFQSEQVYNSDIVEVNYGTSFGMCVGYCKRDVSLKPAVVTYRCSGWNDTIQPLTQTGVLNDTTRDVLNEDL